MAISNDQLLSTFDNQHDYDDKYMLNEQEAKLKFTAQAIKNLENVIMSCG
jgi:hypothetical protein